MPFIVSPNKKRERFTLKIGNDVELYATCLSATEAEEIHRECFGPNSKVGSKLAADYIHKQRQLIIEKKIEGWSDTVKGADGQTLPFTLENLRLLLSDSEFTETLKQKTVNWIESLAPRCLAEGETQADPQG
jgi:hypothetical protein